MADVTKNPDGGVVSYVAHPNAPTVTGKTEQTRAQAAEAAELVRAQLAETNARINRAVGLAMFSYGDSLSIQPPVAGVHGKDWLTHVSRLLDLDKVNSYAVGGSDSLGVAWHVVNGSIGGFGLPAAVGGAKWDGTRRGLVTLSLLINDASATSDRYTGGTINESPINAGAQAGLVGAFRAILAILSSASRSEVENATLTGTWVVNSNVVFSNGTSRYTTTPGDKVDFLAVPFPASGKVHLIMHSLDPALSAAPTVEIRVDDVLVKTVQPATLTMRGQKTTASVTLNYAPCAIEVDAAPGNHKVTVTHVGAAGAMMSLDFIAIPSAAPPPIFHFNEFDPILPTGTATRLANLAVLRPAYAAVCAEFPNVKQIGLVVDGPGFSTADELHPNERGAIEIAAEVAPAIRDFLNVYNPDNLYTGLGAVTTPQFGQNLVPVAAWPAATGVNVRFPSRQMVCISGGVVTGISIDGVATGLTSGAFHVKPGHAISVAYTGVPNYSTWDIS